MNQMPFENAPNEMSYEEFNMLKDIYYLLEYVNKDRKDLRITNDRIRRFAKSADQINQSYPESSATVDPFKDKILNGLGTLNNNFNFVI